MKKQMMLKVCPFCGEEPVMLDDTTVKCWGAWCPITSVKMSVNDWQKRGGTCRPVKPVPEDIVRDMVRAIRKNKKRTAKFIKAIERAHKTADKSKLRFGRPVKTKKRKSK